MHFKYQDNHDPNCSVLLSLTKHGHKNLLLNLYLGTYNVYSIIVGWSGTTISFTFLETLFDPPAFFFQNERCTKGARGQR